LFVELAKVRTHPNADKTGQYRWYNDYALPRSFGGRRVTVRLHATDEDTLRRFNRTENVRPIPPTDPDFTRLYSRRNDAELINRSLDDCMAGAGPQRRPRSSAPQSLGLRLSSQLAVALRASAATRGALAGSGLRPLL
jgi:hypothetical protein